jgi:type I restriction enzyme S subunit
MGVVTFVATDFWPHNTTLFVTDFLGNDPRFIYYFLQTLGLRRYDSGSAQCSLNRNYLYDIPVILPPLPEQRAIAGVLGALDDKIEVNRKTARVLEGIARAVFTSWFVDFDPVRRAAAGRPTGLPAELAALFPKRMVASAIGEVPETPEGWTASVLADHFELTMGQSPPGSTYNEVGAGLPFYQGRTDFGFRFPTPRVYCTAPTRLAQPGDTLVSVRAPVGDVNMAIVTCTVGRGVAAVRHKSGSRSLTYYAMHALRSHFLRFEADGTVFGAIGKTDFERLPFVAPPQPVVDAFERFAAPIDQRIEGCECQSSSLAALRDALLPKLISGELRIADAEKTVGGIV